MPSSWPTKALGEVAKTGSGSTPKADNQAFYRDGTLPFVRIADLTDGDVTHTEACVTELAVEQYRLRTRPVGTLLVAMYGSIGKLGILQVPAATNQAILAVSPDPSQLRTDFLFAFFLSQRERLIHSGFGGVQKNLSAKFLKAVRIPVPPLDEQDDVVAALGALQSTAVALRSQLAELANLRTSLLGDIFAESGM